MSMSWQQHIDHILGSGSVKGAAIIGQGDGTVWASSGLSLRPGEVPALLAAFNNPSIYSKGIFIDNVKHFVCKVDARSIYAKQGPGGVVCVKAKQAIIVGLYNANTFPGQATAVVELFADFLMEQGF